MDNLNAKSGFLPGLFGSKTRDWDDRGTGVTKGSSIVDKLTPRPITFFRKLPNGPRNHFVAMAGEFVGTFLFLFFAFAGTQVANTPVTTTFGNSNDITTSGPNTSSLMFIALSFGFSLAVNAWIFFRVSGGLFNPAVTFGLCLVGAVPLLRGFLVFISQMLGAICSAAVVSALFPGPLAVTTTLSAGTNKAQGVFIEMFLTAQLVFTIFMLAAEKHKGTYLAPVGIGLSLFIAELAGVYYTGGSLNPARSFGPCVANAAFPSDHWVYWVGPLLGALLAAGFYWFIKACEYETANPGQDFDDLEASAFNPEEDITRPVISPTTIIDRSGSQPIDPAILQLPMSQSQQAPARPSGSGDAFASIANTLTNEPQSMDSHQKNVDMNQKLELSEMSQTEKIESFSSHDHADGIAQAHHLTTTPRSVGV